MTAHILIDKADGVLTLTLNRPEKKNALTRAMYDLLGDAISEATADPEIRCILIQANGEMFTAGNDLVEFSTVASEEGPVEATPRGASALIHSLACAELPIIAAVQGRAVGVGTTLLLHCDLVFVAETAALTTPFVNLALVPEAASSLLLPLRVGHARAFSMFVLGEVIDARTAVEWGIANAVVPTDQLRTRARAAAETIATKAPAAVAITKSLMRDSQRYLAKIRDEVGHFSAQLKSPEAQEAFAAFREKRAPDFKACRDPSR
jgi:enoyl-CoA hydratase/carnithine racemase